MEKKDTKNVHFKNVFKNSHTNDNMIICFLVLVVTLVMKQISEVQRTV